MSYDPNDAKSIFLQAAELKDSGERAAFLEKACDGNPDLKARVESLLKTAADPDSLLDTPPADLAATPTRTKADLPQLDFLEPCDVPGRLGRLGGYEVLEVIGSGGMGIVLRALDVKLNRIVAIKVLTPELASNPQSRRRFLREAQAAAAVSHDHVVTIHAVDAEHKVPFLVMECIIGQSLQEKIDKAGALSPPEILRIGMQIAAGLAAAHKQGLVHRDIKPANILLENGVERVKITDFGLARAIDDIGITQLGQIAGTPQYMSPEQAQGQPVDQRSDLFSLGSVLYTMCTGRPAFRGDSAVAVLRRVCDDTPRPIREVNSEIPEWLIAIVNRLMAKQPAERFPTAQEVAAQLERWLAHWQQPAFVSPPPAMPLATASASPLPQPGPGDSRRDVARAAMGLIATGLVNWLTIFAVLAWLVTTQSYASLQGAAWVVFPVLAIGSGVILFGAYRMLHLDSYGWARTSAICSMLIGPGYVIGWPCGLWALAVLARRDVRAAFPVAGEGASETLQRGPASAKRRWWKYALITGAVAVAVWRFGPALVLTARNEGRLAIELHDPQAKAVLRREGQIVAECRMQDSRWTIVRPIPGSEARTAHDANGPTLDLVPGTYHVEIVPPTGRAVDQLFYFHQTLFTGQYSPQPGVTEKELYVGRGDSVTLSATFKNVTPPSHPDFQSLQGRWMIVMQEVDGKPRPASTGRQPVSLVFDGDQARQVEWHNFPPLVTIASASFVINPSVSPKEIDQGWGGRGIYQLDGDTLTLCVSSGSERPTTFDSSAAPSTTLTVLKRAEPDDERLQGRWRVESQEAQGYAVTGPMGAEWVEFSRNMFRMKVNGTETVTERLFELNPSVETRQIDLFGTQDRAHEGTGIYRLDGDTLTLCIGPHDDTRPAEFSSRSNQAMVVTVLKRVPTTHELQPDWNRAVPLDNIAWGPASPKGVQLGIGFDPRRDEYGQGEVVKLRLFLRNVGKTALSTSLPRLEVLEKFDLDLTLTDDKGAPLSWRWGDAHKPRDQWTVSGAMALTLNPDTVHELPAADIAIGEPGSASRSLAVLDVQPGPICRMIAKLGTYGYAMGEGEPLESSAIQFRVAAAPAGTAEAVEPKEPPLAVAPFDAQQAQQHQQAWARYLGVHVEQPNSVGMTLRLIPPGKFHMGSTPEELEQLGEQVERDGGSEFDVFVAQSSGPRHVVELSQPFWMSQHETTVAQFQQFVEEAGYEPTFQAWRAYDVDSDLTQQPVCGVSWDDAKAFCRWLNTKSHQTPFPATPPWRRQDDRSGLVYDLPTEAQWEYACRAGSESLWSCGDDETTLAEYAIVEERGASHPAAIGLRRANAFGLFDMHGNVDEWCLDWHNREFYGRSPLIDPVYLESPTQTGSGRVVRGGRWNAPAWWARSATRSYDFPTNPTFPRGFRVVLVNAPQTAR